MRYAPCNGCAHRPRCKYEQLACPAFESFVEEFETPRWIHKTRIPSRLIFERVFAEELAA